jgi:site-specific DNA recombinase
MKTAVLMARVSSDEQAKGYSLDVQQDALTLHCERNNIRILYAFKEDHSAKSFDRPEFKKFLTFLKANSGKVDYLLFTTWDRFSRNTAEAYEMIDRLKKYGTLPNAVEQPLTLDGSNPEQKALLAFYLALPEIENDRRSIKITGGIRGAWKAGRWTHKAPVGYKNSRDEENKPLLRPSQFSSIVSEIFEEVAGGKPHIEIRMKAKRKGLTLTKSTLSNILRNPLYMGKIPVPADKGEPAYLQKAVHEPIISEELFYSVQNVLNQGMVKKNKPTYTKKRPELPLRGVLKCGKCNSHITGGPSKSRNGSKHFYYTCNHCCKERYKAELANAAVEQVLKDITFNSEYKELYKRFMGLLISGKDKDREVQAKQLKETVQQQDSRLDNLQDMLVDGKISPAEYSNMRTKYEQVKSKALLELEGLKLTSQDFEAQLERALKQVANLSTLYAQLDLDRKARLLGSIFPEKLQFDGEKCRTTKINEVIRLGLALDKGSEKVKTGQISDKLILSGWVEHIGVEPMTSCMPCKRSSQLS